MRLQSHNRKQVMSAFAAAVSAALGAMPAVSSAGSFVWNGGSASSPALFSAPANWVSSSSPPNDGSADLVFASLNANGFNPTYDSSFSVDSLTFNSSAIAFSVVNNSSGLNFTVGTNGITDNASNTETLQALSVYANTSETWHVASGTLNINAATNINGSTNKLTASVTSGTLNLQGAVTGGGILDKTGAGMVTLNNGGSLDSIDVTGGAANISAGTLTLTSIVQPLFVTGGAVNISGGAIVDASLDQEFDYVSAILGASLNVTGGAQYKDGAEFDVGENFGESGTLNVSNSAQFSSQSLEVPYDGTGVLSVASSGVVNSGSLAVGGVSGTLTASGGGSVVITGISSFTTNASVNISGGSFTTEALSSNSTGNGSIALTDPVGGTALTINDPASLDSSTYSGTISGTGSLLKSGASTQYLSGNNSFTGAVNVSGGMLNMNNSAATSFQVSNATLIVNTGAVTGKAFVNSGGLLTGAANYKNVTLNAGATYLPGTYNGSFPAMTGSTALIQPAASGTTTSNAAITLGAPAAITVNGSDTLSLTGSFSPGANAVTKTGTGTVNMNVFNANALTISAGTLALTTSTTGIPLQVGTLSVSGSGTLNLTNGSADISNTSLVTVQALVKQGYNAGAWNGSGISSSTARTNAGHLTAIGVIQNNQSGMAIYNSSNGFLGVSPGAGDVLLAYTYYGDTNLDGKVDGTDYSRIDTAYLSNGTLTGWFNGDFNYDGVIDGSDYTLMDNAYNMESTQLAAEIASPTSQIAASPVPEPSSMLVVLLSSAGLLGRRRNSDRIE